MRTLGRMFRWPTLRARILLALVGLTVAIGVIVGVQATLSMTRVLEFRLEDLGTAIASDLAALSAAPSQTNDIFSLFDVVNDRLLNNEDVRYIFLVEPSGDIRVHTFEQGVPPGLVDANTPELDGQEGIRNLKTSEGEILDIAVPVLGGQGGVIRLGMSDKNLRAQVRDLAIKLSLVVGGGILVAIGLSFIISSLLTRPLSRLTEATRKIGRGDYEGKIPVGTEDEVGELTRAFNTMTDNIIESRESLVRRNAELEILNSMADTLGRQLGRQPVLDRSVDRLLELTQLSAAWVCFKGPDNRIQLSAYKGPDDISLTSREIRPGNTCDCLKVFETGRGVEVRSIAGCPMMGNGITNGSTVRSHAVVPLGSRDGVSGVLVVASDNEKEFDQARIRLLTSIGQQVGAALENASLYDELEQKERIRTDLLFKLIGAQEEERKRIAREIHDEPTQVLTGILMRLDNIGQRLENQKELDKEEIESVKPGVRAAIESLQSITSDLRPQALDDLGLVPALQWFAQQRLGNDGIEVDFNVGGRHDRLPQIIEVAAFRIVQEAINNVAKHANATDVYVRLDFGMASICGQVRDNGVGFDSGNVNLGPIVGAGLGLLGMQERAAILGGSLSVVSSQSDGTVVDFEIPLNRQAEDG